MKKHFFVILIVVILLLLAGCSKPSEIKNNIDSKLDDILLEQSGIKSNSDYQEYLWLYDNGEIDKDGNSIVSEQTPIENPESKKVLITFAKNEYIDISYFYDKDLTKKINDLGCYLNPGDIIYFSEPISECPNSNMFSFDRIVIDEIRKEKRNTVEWIVKGNAIYIPSDFSGTDVSIFPTGKYSKREILFRAYYTENNEKKDIGNWYIDEKEVSGSSAWIDPVSTCYVKYKYDAEKYEYISSNIAPFYVGKKEGQVTYAGLSPTSDIRNFNIELRKKNDVASEAKVNITTNIKDSNIASEFKITTLERELLFSKKSPLKINGEKVGSAIKLNVIEDNLISGSAYKVNVTKEFKNIENKNNTKDEEIYYITNPKQALDIGIYRLVDDKNVACESISIEIQYIQTIYKYQPIVINNAEVIAKYKDVNNNSTIDNGSYIDEDCKIELTIKPINTNKYYIANGNGDSGIFQKEMTYSKYLKNKEKIKSEHQAKKIITVTLITADPYGSVEYKLNGAVIEGEKIKIREGEDKLELVYKLNDKKSKKIEGSIKNTKTIKITNLKNNATLKASDYITVVNK